MRERERAAEEEETKTNLGSERRNLVVWVDIERRLRLARRPMHGFHADLHRDVVGVGVGVVAEEERNFENFLFEQLVQKLEGSLSLVDTHAHTCATRRRGYETGVLGARAVRVD